jgi:hypothetical protein
LVVPVEELMRDLPFAIPLEQREHVRSSSIGPRQLARPVLNFQMHNSDALDDLDAREARIDIRSRAVCGDPLEHMFYRAAILNSLTVPGDGCGRMKGRTHEFAVARASASNLAMHGTGDRVMFGKIGVGRGFELGKALGLIAQDFAGHLVRNRLQASISCR